MNRKRVHSRSNQALMASMGSQSQMVAYIGGNEVQQKQLFKQSFEKIQRIKKMLIRNTNQQLTQQLNDIIDLIKGQRVKAKFTIQQLAKINEYNSNQAPETKNSQDQAVNTDQFLFGFDDDTCLTKDQSIQTQSAQLAQLGSCKGTPSRESTKKFESYFKLVCMIDKIGVDYRKILPILKDLPQNYALPDVEANISNYKVLKNDQIVKLQTVFINKFNSMLMAEMNKNESKPTCRQMDREDRKSAGGDKLVVHQKTQSEECKNRRMLQLSRRQAESSIKMTKILQQL